ncbi:UspA domain-containing protein [Hyphomonas polymorpha PS728]|uniref:UspA domain-containing protein n=2 Tax=Hyphomonas polymorpha TaxID=74319 RepID=A0A062VMA5_9PROT|nr:UspA domain-containing protein [Hyphomonas polymorpha PS728]
MILRKILAATRFSESCARAQARAMHLAEKTEADLLLVHAGDADAQDQLNEAAKAAGAAAQLKEGDPAKVILETARGEEAELIVVGAPGRRNLREMLTGTNVEQVIRQSSVPVLMAVNAEDGPYRRVLLTTDFSEASVLAATSFFRSGMAAGAQVYLCNVFDTPAIRLMTTAGTTTADIQHYIAEQQEASADNLKVVAEQMGLAHSGVLPRLQRGTAAQTICAVAQEIGAELIVVGTQGHSGIRRFFLGSVAEEVLRKSPVDVLAVPALA